MRDGVRNRRIKIRCMMLNCRTGKAHKKTEATELQEREHEVVGGEPEGQGNDPFCDPCIPLPLCLLADAFATVCLAFCNSTTPLLAAVSRQAKGLVFAPTMPMLRVVVICQGFWCWSPRIPRTAAQVGSLDRCAL